MEPIEFFKKIVKEHQAEEYEGVLIDATTANFVCQIDKRLNEVNQTKFRKLGVFRMINITMEMI